MPKPTLLLAQITSKAWRRKISVFFPFYPHQSNFFEIFMINSRHCQGKKRYDNSYKGSIFALGLRSFSWTQQLKVLISAG